MIYHPILQLFHSVSITNIVEALLQSSSCFQPVQGFCCHHSTSGTKCQHLIHKLYRLWVMLSFYSPFKITLKGFIIEGRVHDVHGRRSGKTPGKYVSQVLK